MVVVMIGESKGKIEKKEIAISLCKNSKHHEQLMIGIVRHSSLDQLMTFFIIH